MKTRPAFRFLTKATTRVAQAAFALSLSLLMTTTSNADEIGDVNLDGVVNLLDVDPFIDLLSTGNYQFEADTNGDSVVNLLDVDPFIAILSGGGVPDDSPQLGVPLEIQFTPSTLVDFVLVTVKRSWLCESKDYEFFLDIEITGLNGVFQHHGTQLVSVHDTNTFDVDVSIASVIVDWTTDMLPTNANETYTFCVQVVRYDIQQDIFENIGELKCAEFGPF